MPRVGSWADLRSYLTGLYYEQPQPLFPENPAPAQIYRILATYCPHDRRLQVCNVCKEPWNLPHCHARDPAILDICQNCPWHTLS